MKNLRKIIVIAACIALIFSMAGCASLKNFKSTFLAQNEGSVEPILIGVYEPMSGQYKAQGNLEIMGIELAHELYPTLLGREVKLVYVDNRSTLDDAKTALDTLFAKKPLLVLGSYGEALTLAAGDYLKYNCIPGITITSTNPLLTTNNNYCFCATYTEDMQGVALADFAYQSQAKLNLATVKIYGDDTTNELVQRFTEEAKSFSDKVKVTSFSIAAETTDYSDIVARLKKCGAEGVLLAMSEGRARELMTSYLEVQEKHKNILFLGTRAWDTEDMSRFLEANDRLEAAFCTDEAQLTDNEMAETFFKAFREKYGNEAQPTSATTVAFDAYILAITAIEDAYRYTTETPLEEFLMNFGSDAEREAMTAVYAQVRETGLPTGRLVRDRLSVIKDFQGASGIISYENTNTATKPITIEHVFKNIEEENEYVITFDENGNIILDYDENGNVVIPLDRYQRPMIEKNSKGKWVVIEYPEDETGTTIDVKSTDKDEPEPQGGDEPKPDEEDPEEGERTDGDQDGDGQPEADTGA